MANSFRLYIDVPDENLVTEGFILNETPQGMVSTGNAYAGHVGVSGGWIFLRLDKEKMMWYLPFETFAPHVYTVSSSVQAAIDTLIDGLGPESYFFSAVYDFHCLQERQAGRYFEDGVTMDYLPGEHETVITSAHPEGWKKIYSMAVNFLSAEKLSRHIVISYPDVKPAE